MTCVVIARGARVNHGNAQTKPRTSRRDPREMFMHIIPAPHEVSGDLFAWFVSSQPAPYLSQLGPKEGTVPVPGTRVALFPGKRPHWREDG